MADTIVAQASAVGSAGVAIIRISGPSVVSILKAQGLADKPRCAQFATLRAGNGSVIDHGIWIYFSAPNSFTGEDVLEFQGHGNQCLIELVLKRFLELGCRLAEPGEFSKRAFLNNKMDLLQAEAVADLVAARSATAARMALASLSGNFSSEVSTLLKEVIACRVQLEAALDFPDEDFDPAAKEWLERALNSVLEQITRVLGAAEKGAAIQSGLDVVLLGPPNVGKSSLFNALLGQEEAIVTPIAGTTRDVLSQECKIGSVSIKLLDTAGIHLGSDAIEREGIIRAKARIKSAHIILLVLDDRFIEQKHDWFIDEHSLPRDKKIIPIWNKIDLFDEALVSGTKISIKNKFGFDCLLKELKDAVKVFAGGEEHAFIARARHVAALNNAYKHCESAIVAMNALSWELAAEDCRQLQHELSKITGVFSNEDLLTEIFSTFCIGK